MEEKDLQTISPDEITAEGEEDIVVLLSETGEEIEFVEIAGIAHNGKFYAILQPVELIEGMEEDEALVFEVLDNGEGNSKFELCLDDDIIDAVFEEYNRLYDEMLDEDNN